MILARGEDICRDLGIDGIRHPATDQLVLRMLCCMYRGVEMSRVNLLETGGVVAEEPVAEMKADPEYGVVAEVRHAGGSC